MALYGFTAVIPSWMESYEEFVMGGADVRLRTGLEDGVITATLSLMTSWITWMDDVIGNDVG